MGWTVQGSNPSEGVRFSAPIQTGPGAHPASYTMGTGSFQGVKQAGAWRWPPTHILRWGWSQAIRLLHLWALVACSGVNCTFTFYQPRYPLSSDCQLDSRVLIPGRGSHFPVTIFRLVFSSLQETTVQSMKLTPNCSWGYVSPDLCKLNVCICFSIHFV
jgi:hypothetical protein